MDEYENRNVPQMAMSGAQLGRPLPPSYDPTIRVNLDNRIAELKKDIEELERIKAGMPSDLIDMKISDLREAMRF